MANTPYGHCHVYRETHALPAAVEIPDLEYLLSDPRLRGFDPDDALYLDIEATGLSHGAGTFAFLIGCAYVEDGQVVLEQLCMENPSDEMPVLGRFMELFERFGYIVSFNGKSYDLSVLQARLCITRLMSKIDAQLKLRPHLDLLHVCRQAYKGLYENVKLQTLEREVLHIDPAERADDVPGMMVPALYFHYLQTGYAPAVDPVLKHNRTDVLSMITLTRHMMNVLSDASGRHAVIQYNLGRAALRRKQNERAATLLTGAVEGVGLDPQTYRKALLELVTAQRRAGNPQGALAAARALLEKVPSWDCFERDRLCRQIGRFEKKIAREASA